MIHRIELHTNVSQVPADAFVLVAKWEFLLNCRVIHNGVNNQELVPKYACESSEGPFELRN